MPVSDITIVGLAAIGGQSQNALSWGINDPNIYGLSELRFHHAEVWAAGPRNPSTLPGPVGDLFVKLEPDAYGQLFGHLPIQRGMNYLYKVRAIDRAGNAGEFSAEQDATEISGQVSLVAAPFYWKRADGLIREWGSGLTNGSGVVTPVFNLIVTPLEAGLTVVSTSTTLAFSHQRSAVLSVKVGAVLAQTSFQVWRHTVATGAVAPAASVSVSWWAYGIGDED